MVHIPVFWSHPKVNVFKINLNSSLKSVKTDWILLVLQRINRELQRAIRTIYWLMIVSSLFHFFSIRLFWAFSLFLCCKKQRTTKQTIPIDSMIICDLCPFCLPDVNEFFFFRDESSRKMFISPIKTEIEFHSTSHVDSNNTVSDDSSFVNDQKKKTKHLFLSCLEKLFFRKIDIMIKKFNNCTIESII